ncbi:MAG: hypothetical protein VB980_03035 [Opitutales bacterium]|jgi:hypothetical protein
MSPREELESRVVAMLLGEADDFEKTELDAILGNDSSLSAFRDEMARSIDIVGEAAVVVPPVGSFTDAPKLSPARRQEVEQAWSAGSSASAKTTTMATSLAKMHPFIPLVMAAGVGLAAGTALVTLSNDDGAAETDVGSLEMALETPAESSNPGTPNEAVVNSPSNLKKLSVFDIPEGVATQSSLEGIDEQKLKQARMRLEEGLRELSDKSVTEPIVGHLNLDRETEGFEFDPKGIAEKQKESNTSNSHPGILSLGPPNALALTEDKGVASTGFPSAPPVPNVPHFELESGADDSLLAKAGGVTIPFATGVFGKGSQEKRELLAKHETIATYKGYGNSGVFATFVIDKYLHHQKLEKYGSAEQAKHLIQVSDFRRKSVGDPKILKLIAELQEGDRVWLSWNHDHVTHKGSSAPDWPIQKMGKLTKQEEQKFFPR